MAIDKAYLEFHAVQLDEGWQAPLGAPAGIEEKILAGSLDETNKRGSRTRLIRFAPGAHTTKPFEHDYWEEAYVLAGDLIAGGGDYGALERFGPNAYACRPPGTPHGPFKSETGCLALEIHYYDPA